MEKKREKENKKEKITERKERPIHHESRGENKVEQALIENFVSLQHVMANLALKFDNLSSQISKLLELFEISAKTLAEKNYSPEENKTDRRVMEKLDNLIEQNKVLARGITLLHEKDSEKQYPPPSPGMQRPLPYSSQRLPPETKNPKFSDMNI